MWGRPASRSAIHRPRGSKPRQVDLILLNSSGERQLSDAMNFYRRSRSSEDQGQKQMQVAAIIAQEHHLVGDRWMDFQLRSRKSGWKVDGVHSVECLENNSAGVCIAVRTRYGSGTVPGLAGESAATQDSGLAHRLTYTWLYGVLRGGVLILSLYLWHSEGFSRRTMELLWAAGELITKHGGPWILRADFNMTPADLAAAK